MVPHPRRLPRLRGSGQGLCTCRAVGQDRAHEPGMEPLAPFLTQPTPAPRLAKGQGRWEDVGNPRKRSLKDMKMKSIKEIKMEISRQQLLF